MVENTIDMKKLQKVLIIYNHNSGKQFFASMAAKMHEVVKIFQDRFGKQNVWVPVFKRFFEFKDIIAQAKQDHYDWVVVAGGDGTIRAVIEQMQAQEFEPYVSVFPAGTVNLTAKELQLPADPYKWTKKVFKGREKPVYIGKCNGKTFLTVTGIGFDSLVVDRVTELEKKLLSKFAYVLQGTELMRKELLFSHWRYQFQARFDDEDKWYDASSLIIGKSRFYAGRYCLFNEAALKEPYLFTAVFPGNKRSDFLRYAALIGMEKLSLDKNIMVKKSKKVEVRCNVENFPTELDGDAVTEAPLSVEVVAKPIKFLA